MVFWRSAGWDSKIDDARKIPEIRVIFTDFERTCPVCLLTIFYAQASENES